MSTSMEKPCFHKIFRFSRQQTGENIKFAMATIATRTDFRSSRDFIQGSTRLGRTMANRMREVMLMTSNLHKY